MSQLIGSFARQVHSFNTGFVQRSDVDVQTAADTGDILHVLGLIRHDRASAAGEQDIGDVVDSHIIGDVMNKRYIFSDIIKTFSQHMDLQ